MSKTAVVFWSGTGNTEEMANAVLEGMKGAGADASIYSADSFQAADVAGYDAIAFGCPAMGAEVLEEDEFQPSFDWEDDCKDAGAELVCDSVICNDAPDDDAVAACKALGAALV